MKYVREFDKSMVNEDVIPVNMLQDLANSLISNNFIDVKNGKIKVTGIVHEDGSGKKFNVTYSIYKEDKFERTETKFYELK